MRDDRPIIKSIGTTVSPIDELIADNKITRLNVRLQRAGGTRADNYLAAKLFKGPDVCSVIDLVGRYGVVSAVSGHERDLSSLDRRKHDTVTCNSVRRVDFDFRDVFQQAVKA